MAPIRSRTAATGAQQQNSRRGNSNNIIDATVRHSSKSTNNTHEKLVTEIPEEDAPNWSNSLLEYEQQDQEVLKTDRHESIIVDSNKPPPTNPPIIAQPQPPPPTRFTRFLCVLLFQLLDCGSLYNTGEECISFPADYSSSSSRRLVSTPKVKLFVEEHYDKGEISLLASSTVPSTNTTPTIIISSNQTNIISSNAHYHHQIKRNHVNYKINNNDIKPLSVMIPQGSVSSPTSSNITPTSTTSSSSLLLFSSTTPSASSSSSSSICTPPRPITIQHSYQFTCQYIQNIFSSFHTQIPVSCLLIALLYIHRITKKNGFRISIRGTEGYLFGVAFMTAMKFLLDHSYSTRTWIHVLQLKDDTNNNNSGSGSGGCSGGGGGGGGDVSGETTTRSTSSSNLARMEREFLSRLQWKCHVDDVEYSCWFQYVQGLGLRYDALCDAEEEEEEIAHADMNHDHEMIKQQQQQQHQQQQHLLVYSVAR